MCFCAVGFCPSMWVRLKQFYSFIFFSGTTESILIIFIHPPPLRQNYNNPTVHGSVWPVYAIIFCPLLFMEEIGSSDFTQRLLRTWGCVLILTLVHFSKSKVTGRKTCIIRVWSISFFRKNIGSAYCTQKLPMTWVRVW